MKKIAIAAALALTALFCFVGCSSGSGNNEHTHTFASDWSYDENKHWHASTCGHDVAARKPRIPQERTANAPSVPISWSAWR